MRKFTVFLFLFCSACSYGPIEDEALLRGAVAETAAKATRQEIWAEGLTGIDASVKVDGAPAGGANLILTAVFREKDEAMRFALFLPQGSKLGQCLKAGGDVKCESIPAPGAGTFVREAFSALESLRSLRFPDNAKAAVHKGDLTTGISPDTIVLRRSHKQGNKTWTILNSLDGEPLAAYLREDGELIWKSFFNGRGQYSFSPVGQNLTFQIKITRYLP